MDSRQRMIDAIEHKMIDRFPRDVWTWPNVSLLKNDLYNDFLTKYEIDIGHPRMGYMKSGYEKGIPDRIGSYTDEFGCTFDVGEDGVVGEVKKAMFEDFDMLDSYKMPYEIIKAINKDAVSEQCKKSGKFMVAGSHIRPFERIQFMRGTEDLFCDLATGEPKIEKLIALLHDFYLKELDIITDTAVDGFTFMDDWGSQISLLISPKIWRQLFKPLYKDYVDMAHSKDKYAFFHTDGFIEEIYPDLVEIGVDVINSQLTCMNIEKIVDLYGDKICFWGEPDRQHTIPFGSVADIEREVDRIADSVIKKNGKRTGAIAQCTWNAFDPYENILAVFRQWDKK